MTKAEAYLDRLYYEWQVWQEKLNGLSEFREGVNDLIHPLYSRLAQTASTRYYAAKYMMQLMKEDANND